MTPASAQLVACTVIVGGLAAWLTLAVSNNIRDRGTNVTLLGRMMRMDELRADPELGNGLIQRAVPSSSRLPQQALAIVIAVQIAIAALLWCGAVALAMAVGGGDATAGITIATLGLTAFAALWIGFLIGGLWFGYWIKMAHVQQVHLTLLAISVGALVLLRLA